jgi:hypothetical protein
MQPHADGVKVLFLAGKGRSGGTLLANLLGQIPGFFNVGELNRLWDSGLVHNHRCGCGLRVQECPTWQAILDEADSLLHGRRMVPIANARIDLDQAAVVRWRNVLRLFTARIETRDRWEALERYTTAASAVYRGIAAVTGARVVIDSTRVPFEPVALGLVPGVDVSIAHVVRDPRAVAYSWKRSRVLTDRDTVEHMPRWGVAYSAASWLTRGLLVELLSRRHLTATVNYDALAREPVRVLRELVHVVGEPEGDIDFLTSGSATLMPTHSVGGNPVRMLSGVVTIEPDDEWRRGMSRRDRMVATMFAMPRLRRYGFSVRSSDGAPARVPRSGVDHQRPDE